MQMNLVPGYENLFGKPDLSYEELLQDLPSEIVISMVIVLNNEVNAPIRDSENQARLREIVAWRFSTQQRQLLDSAYHSYMIKTKGTYQNVVFVRRHLLAFILREVKRNKKVELTDTSGDQEYNFLLAYLMVIDEVNAKELALLKEVRKHKNDDTHPYRLLWTPLINQYQLAEETNVPYEMFKLFCFLKYALSNYRPYLKEYINSLGFITLGNFLHSLYQVAIASKNYDETEVLSKLNYIAPVDGVDAAHLDAMCFNKRLGQQDFSLFDIKTNPLYRNRDGRYMIVDEHIYNKKFYNGPFFELRTNTSLSRDKKFNEYSSDISKSVLEGSFFSLITKGLRSKKGDFIYFDDRSDDVPDCYYRRNKTIFLLEFKAYFFPEGLSENPDFEQIKKYIDERFVKNEKGKNKGISQILKQIDLLFRNQLNFDTFYNKKLHSKKITIYPIICHSEHNFSLPGINDYLNEQFIAQLKPEWKERFLIKNLTLINLEVLFDMMQQKGKYTNLADFITQYWAKKSSYRIQLARNPVMNNFLGTYSSFDENYRVNYEKSLINNSKGHEDFIINVMEQIKLTQAELDENI